MFPRYQCPRKHVQSFPAESYLMLSFMCTGPRRSSASPLRAPVWTLVLLCLRYQLEYTAHKMQLWLVPFKTTGTDTFVKHNMCTGASGHGVQTCLYPRDESPFLTPKLLWVFLQFLEFTFLYKEWVNVAHCITYL